MLASILGKTANIPAYQKYSKIHYCTLPSPIFLTEHKHPASTPAPVYLYYFRASYSYWLASFSSLDLPAICS